MDVALTHNHINWLNQSGFRFYVPSLPGVVGEGKVKVILHPFKTEKEALEFISETNLRVAPLDFSSLNEKSFITKAIEEKRCFLYDSEAEERRKRNDYKKRTA